MSSSKLVFENKYFVTENDYDIESEAIQAALFTTSNGYIGVRGSFEEFGSLRIQGCYIRGLLDEVYELPQPFPDNIYMKKYYLNEEKLKDFEKQECIINFVDILMVRISIDGETFYPWEGKLLGWKRYLDMENACLIREVRWSNCKGDITYLKFERFASFENDHIFCIRVTIKPENHNKKIEVLSGLDTKTKTNGQKVTKAISAETSRNKQLYSNLSGEKYKFTFYTGVCSNIYNSQGEETGSWEEVNDDGKLAGRVSFEAAEGTVYTLEKKVYTITSRDISTNLEDNVKENIGVLEKSRYDELFSRHKKQWKDFFEKIDIIIDGDVNSDVSLRLSNYHTAISIPRNDSIHSLAAKGLTGETYNNFVWWDCEVYQLPPFYHTVPGVAKNMLKYRFEKLDAAREMAMQEGRRGARFPFISAVEGKELVWKYVRHPFLQVHIVADVAWAVINYYICTGDTEFMLNNGLEVLWEVARYWASRVEYNKEMDRYEIKTVTGTDEHHPYVDNNAYTNYLVCLVLKYAAKMYERFKDEVNNVTAKIGLAAAEVEGWTNISGKIYLPMQKNTGMIPQFDGYFSLNKSLEISGGSAAKSFQMKESGLYHESQVIKQPDVMLLFSYINLKFDEEIYKRNWNYYEARCEASSSLSYPVHSICASDMGQHESAYKYFLRSARLDLDDVHNCAWQGIHSACAAGAWLAVVRGVSGIIFREDMVEVNPHMIPWWKMVKFSIMWHGQKIRVVLTNESITLESDSCNTKPILLSFRGNYTELGIDESISFKTSLKAEPRESVDKLI